MLVQKWWFDKPKDAPEDTDCPCIEPNAANTVLYEFDHFIMDTFIKSIENWS